MQPDCDYNEGIVYHTVYSNGTYSWHILIISINWNVHSNHLIAVASVILFVSRVRSHNSHLYSDSVVMLVQYDALLIILSITILIETLHISFMHNDSSIKYACVVIHALAIMIL